MSPHNGEDLPAFVLWEADFQLSTVGWNEFEKMVYHQLIIRNWYVGVLPATVRELAAICGLPVETFAPIWKSRLRKKFPKTKGGRSNPRIARDRERAKRQR